MSKPHYTEWIPKIIYVLRTDQDLTQTELAQRVGLARPTSISEYESGKVVPSLEMLDKLFTALGVTLILGFENTTDVSVMDNKWAYVRKDTLRQIVHLVESITPEDES